MKRGDLVRLKPFCKDRDRLALVVEEQCGGFTKIIFADTGEKVAALVNNLMVVNEKGRPSKA
tara:strand:- start:246 stop:431 length:186 start_codon:yes stop_codon:yes gene_type:complete